MTEHIMADAVTYEDDKYKELPSIEEATQIQDDLQLIDFVLERFHKRHRVQLKNLIALAEKVETVHSEHQACPKGLSQYLTAMAQELEQHMFKEENILFPMIRAGQGTMVIGPISVMKHEHEEHAEAIRGLEAKINQPAMPSDACATWRNLYQGIEEFIADLRAHIALENDVLFARQ